MNTGPLIASGLIILIFCVGVARVFFGYWVVRRDADEEWETFCQQNPKQAKKTTQEKFTNTYRLTHNPRGLAYSTAALAAAALITPISVMLLTLFYDQVIVQEFDPNAPAASTVAEEVRRQFRRDGPLVYSFFIFFGLIASWGAVAYVTARMFHAKDRLASHDDLREIQGLPPLESIEPVRKRPKWSPLVKGKDGLVLSKNHKSPSSNQTQE